MKQQPNNEYVQDHKLNFKTEYMAFVNAIRVYRESHGIENLLEIMSRSRTTIIALNNLVNQGHADGIFEHYYEHYLRVINRFQGKLTADYESFRQRLRDARRKPREEKSPEYQDLEMKLQTLVQCRLCFINQISKLKRIANSYKGSVEIMRESD